MHISARPVPAFYADDHASRAQNPPDALAQNVIVLPPLPLLARRSAVVDDASSESDSGSESFSDAPSDGRSVSSDGLSDDGHDLDLTGGIPKPSGEVGHPARGGYSLAGKLNWHPQEYKSLKVLFLHRISVVQSFTFS